MDRKPLLNPSVDESDVTLRKLYLLKMVDMRFLLFCGYDNCPQHLVKFGV